MKIALVHDYLREYGGAERVLEALHQLYPEAPVYVAFVDWGALGDHAQRFRSWDIHETWMAHIPFIKKLYSPLRVIADKAFASLDLSAYDVVISSSNAYFAKAVRAPHGIHICYCHTPPRSLYGYTTMTNWKANPVTHFFGTLINHYCRVIDFYMAQKVTYFIANSKETARRITKFYRRDSTVIYPPVELPSLSVIPAKAGIQKNSVHQGYYLYVNRLSFSKHPEIAVAAANKLQLSLKVVGTGAMLSGLRELAGPTVDFLGSISDEELAAVYSGAIALVYPVADEDFGIVPVEAMQYGLPVIAHRSGGPMETIIDGQTGVFFDELTTDGLVSAIQKFQKMKFSSEKITKHSQTFSKKIFQKKIQEFVTDVISNIKV